MNFREAQSEIAAVRAMLEDLYQDVGRGASQLDIRAGLDACTDMLLNIEEGLDDA